MMANQEKLLSAVVKYSLLRDLLVSGQWKKANEQTGANRLGEWLLLRQALRLLCLTISILSIASHRAVAQSSPTFPIAPSANGHYLRDATGKPFIYLADTAWQLPWKLKTEEIEEYFENRRNKGFTAIHLHSLPHRMNQTDAYGNSPFRPKTMDEPNNAYWSNIDWILQTAESKGLMVAISVAWLSQWEQDWHKLFNVKVASRFCEFLGQRYKQRQNIMWIHGGDDDAKALHGAIRVCGRILARVAPHHLQTFHGFQKLGAQFFQLESWYDVNMAYSYSYTELFDQLSSGFKLVPAKPVLVGESHYENNNDNGKTARDMRAIAYLGVINSGGVGGAYGHGSLWKIERNWREALDAPSATQIGFPKKLFDFYRFTDLVPSVDRRFVLEGRGDGDRLLSAALSATGKNAMIYTPTTRNIVVNVGVFSAPVKAFWFDPTNGKIAGSEDVLRSGKQKFTPPKKQNWAGDPDWVLIFASRNYE
jgi:hypothetical protein